MSIITDLSPTDLGLANYDDFRRIQHEALEFACETFAEKRFCAVALPTGAGKTLFAFALAKLLGLRSVFSTATLGVQEQYSKFQPYGLVNIMGQSNYTCLDYAHLNCRSGGSLGCRYKKGKGCSYEEAKGRAKNAQYVSDNYAYWLAVNDKANGLERSGEEADWAGENPPELLVFDEGHEAHIKLADYISCRLLESELRKFGDWPVGEDLQVWAKYASQVLPALEAEIRTTNMELVHLGKKVKQEHVDVLHKLQALETKLGRIAFAKGDDWVVEKEEGTKWGRLWKFDSVFPGKYAERYLFCNAPKVLIMSATLKPKTLGLLGIKKEEYGYKSWRRIFPANRHEIFQTGAIKPDGKTVRIDRRTSKEDMQLWINWLDDEVLKPMLDRKGIIQSVSYDRQRYIMEHSRYAEHMIGNTSDPDSETAQEIAAKFRKAKPPCILVSPSFSTGWDFPATECEFIVLVKVPFESNQGKLVKARNERDPSYSDYKAMQMTEQAIGRGMRFEMDRCRCILADGHFEWFLHKNKHHAQDWFVQAIRKVNKLPPPQPKLEIEDESKGKRR